jgi:hypothetical protein
MEDAASLLGTDFASNQNVCPPVDVMPHVQGPNLCQDHGFDPRSHNWRLRESVLMEFAVHELLDAFKQWALQRRRALGSYCAV